MSLNVNINPLNFREMRLREPQGARQFGEAIDAWKRGSARRRAERIEDEARRRAERIEDEDRARAERIEDEDRARAEEERQRKQALDNELADMLDVDNELEAIDAEIKQLEADNKALESQAAPKPVSSEYDFTDFSVV